MCELKFFLGLQICQQKNGTFISQEKYLKDCLKKFGLIDCRTIKTPMPTNVHLDADEKGKPFDQKKYCSVIGSLLYLYASRPEIMLSVCMWLDFRQIQKNHIILQSSEFFDILITHLPWAYGIPKVLYLISLDILTRTGLVIVSTGNLPQALSFSPWISGMLGFEE